MDFRYLYSLCSCCHSLLNFFLKPTLHPQLIFSHYLTHHPIHGLNESFQRTPQNTDSFAKTCARALLSVNAVMRHNATITFNSNPAFFVGPKTTCANFKLQLSTDHASLNITSLIVIKIVSILQPNCFDRYALSKLNKQNEQTWVNMQKRLNEVQFPYDRLFSSDVLNFVKNKALSVGSCKGYFIPSLLTTTALVLASNQATVTTLTYSQPLNIYTIFVGYPGTGKFPEFSMPTIASNLFM